MNEKRSILELLLRGETPNVRKSLPTARYRVKRLSELLGKRVIMAADVVGPDAQAKAAALKPGEIMLLENTLTAARMHGK